MEKVLNEDSSSIEIPRLDSEWRNLLLEAKSIGLTVKEVRAFFQGKKE
ncbi:anti-repressor SinI family protein [Bacillus niameyensis]|nr:anti-repressor SinI family protein [Bacillus niameyensis]